MRAVLIIVLSATLLSSAVAAPPTIIRPKFQLAKTTSKEEKEKLAAKRKKGKKVAASGSKVKQPTALAPDVHKKLIAEVFGTAKTKTITLTLKKPQAEGGTDWIDMAGASPDFKESGVALDDDPYSISIDYTIHPKKKSLIVCSLASVSNQYHWTIWIEPKAGAPVFVSKDVTKLAPGYLALELDPGELGIKGSTALADLWILPLNESGEPGDEVWAFYGCDITREE
jgi:hypothetical protein